MTSLIEPVVIVLMGAVIGGLLVAMYLPMFDMIGAIK
jgi:type IV pilus assembly protein PilC